MAAHIERVINKPTAVRQLARGRPAYWDEKSQSVEIHDRNSHDRGTAFKPELGRQYFEGLE